MQHVNGAYLLVLTISLSLTEFRLGLLIVNSMAFCPLSSDTFFGWLPPSFLESNFFTLYQR